MPKHRPIAKKKNSTVGREPSFEGQARDLTSDGRGVVRHPDGRTCFVSGLWPGEVAEIQPVGRQGKVVLGQVVALRKLHAQRRDAPCRHHGQARDQCGGCPWMFMDYEAQCEAKWHRFEKAISGLRDGATQVDSLRSAPEELGYRNRAQFKTDGRQLGYVAGGSRRLIDIEACPILNTVTGRHLDDLRVQLPNKAWQARKGDWHTVDVDDETLLPSIDKRLPFRQGNTQQNGAMRSWLAEVISEMPVDTAVTELFSGSGNLTEVLVQQFTTVRTVESLESAVALSAERLGERVRAHCLNLYSPVAVADWVHEVADTQLLVLDPPREGLKVRDPLLHGLPRLNTIIYLSCDAATWMRDAAAVVARGFRLARITPLDLFPQTPHLEVLSVFTRG